MVNKIDVNYTREYWVKEGYTLQCRNALQIRITDCPNSYEVVQILLKAGACAWLIDQFKPDLYTQYFEFYPLTYAILEKRLDIAALLVEYGGDANNQSLCQAIRIGFLEGIEFLLKHGAEVNKLLYGRLFIKIILVLSSCS